MTTPGTLMASIAAGEADLFGPLEVVGPRIGADRGEPVMSIRVLHRDGPLEVGIWECTPGGWAIEHRPNTETVHILAGRGRITDADGTVHELEAGVAIVLPLGWSGRWDITETLRKLYVTVGS
ncbi:MAG: hypothetical protein HW391_2135 [Chloroflexi bacterium]|nr:hypothetical protein [Chloroflexota bacterium]